MGYLELITETDNVSIYSPKYEGETLSEFEKFLVSNQSHSNPQLKIFFDAIISVVRKIEECGARENLFRLEGGKVKAIPLVVHIRRLDKTVGKMRLYCLRLSERVLIIGNGGVTTARRYEEDPIHFAYVTKLRELDQHIWRLVRQAGTDFDDFKALTEIIQSIII